jgi:hypothetical protein
MPPPSARIAPYAISIEGEAGADEADEHCFSTGNFILLHDPSGRDKWDGDFRVVIFTKSDVDEELANDPLLAEIAWSWLTEALAGLPVTAMNGAVTRNSSTTFDPLIESSHSSIEIRSSWTVPDEHLAAYFEAWISLLATAAGLPPILGKDNCSDSACADIYNISDGAAQHNSPHKHHNYRRNNIRNHARVESKN